MGTLFAMTFPALVVLLVVAAVVDVVVTRRRNRRAADAGQQRARPKVAAAGFDVLGLALAPSTRHKQEHDEHMELDRDDGGDAGPDRPRRSRVDLDAGVARIVVPHRPDDHR